MKHFRLFIVSLVAVVSLFGCQKNSVIPSSTETAIEGRVYAVGSTAIEGNWTPPPLERVSTIIVVNSTRQALKEFLTDEKGSFKISLSPGTYFLRVKESLIPTDAGPFEVKANAITSVKAYYDNGIR